MKDYYEELWTRLPEELEPPDFELRRAFMLSAVRPGARVLDLGSGAGQFTAELVQAGADVVGVEIAEAAVARGRAGHPGLDFRLAPIEGPLPLEDGSFEVVWASEVIEHVADTASWLSDVRRVLVPGGKLLLTTPSHGRLRLAVRGIEPFSEPLGDHLHLYTRRSLRTLLEEFGFGEIEVRTAAGLPLLKRLLLAEAER
jgi:SAM-dependent methyltransferase